MSVSIKQKLWTLVGFFIFTIVLVSAGLLREIKSGVNFSEDLVRDHLKPIQYLADIEAHLQENRAQLLLALQHDPKHATSKLHDHETDVHTNMIAKNKKLIDELFEKYLQHEFGVGEKALLDDLVRARNDYVNQGLQPVLASIEKGEFDKGTELLLKEMNPRVNETFSRSEKLSDMLRRTTDTQVQEEFESHAFVQKYTIAALVLVCIACAITSGWLIRTITEPIESAIGHANTIASGDLTGNISGSGTHETGRLLRSLGEMSASLGKIVKEVRSGSESISTASHEIAIGNADLAARTERQAAALEQTAASVEELTSTIRLNAESSKEADAMVRNTATVVQKAGNSMTDVVKVMESIDQSSHKIVDIISVIDGIAFQTNILALNAAVEAARAGDQGKGFAVVASEVRNLAQRSAAAAKEIKTLILSSVERVESGIVLVGETGTTMNQVVKSVGMIVQIIASISESGHEQRLGVEEINKAISDMDGVTQQNAALVEEAAAAAESLENQSKQLKGVISTFKIGRA
jgi:methyl-accepting chemotaxis protein